MTTTSADEIYTNLINAAQGAFAESWQAVKIYAEAEFKKMSLQLSEIARNIALYQIDNTQGYSLETGKLLFQMQRNACESVLVAVTQLTILAVQKALNAILDSLKQSIGGIIATIL